MSSSLVDLLDELLDAGAVVQGDVTISLAGVDLLSLDLRLLLCSVLTLSRPTADADEGDDDGGLPADLQPPTGAPCGESR
ncbi:gas vesicle protein [Acidimicrobiaceae bacterium USS-CC1]|uniref:Gas vesicle protein n=1 Tax=Acidiferrimicrobium australe TaxID=2664430 RepID=A0ABW9QTQ9_9ACTN|nr:gas vesicle protein [Acidiferrimicrobium australe]